MVRQRCVNPFFHRIEITTSQMINIVVGSIFLVPIRVLLSLLLFAIASSLSCLYLYILKFFDKQNSPDTYYLVHGFLKSHILFLFRSILFICGFYSVKIVQKGDPAKEKDAPIYVFAPHTSLFDMLAGVVFNAPSSVSKADTVDIPLFGSIFKLSEPVLVNRDSPNSRQEVFTKVAEVVKRSKIVFFPEGTCSNHRVLLHFKNGAFKFGYPVLPMAIRFNQYGGPDTLSWTWDGPNTFLLIWLTLARWRTDMEITKLPVYYPSEAEKQDADLYASNVSKVFEKELKIPCLFYSFDDAKFFKYSFFRSSTCVKFVKLCDKLRQLKAATPVSDPEKVHSPKNGFVKKKSGEKKPPDTLFTIFLYQLIDESLERLASANLSDKLNEKKLIEFLGASSVSGLSGSSSVKEFMFCLSKLPADARLAHLKMILHLIDFRVEDLWTRLRTAYEVVGKRTTLSQESLFSLLWIALNLQDVHEDKEIAYIQITSFEDLRNMAITHYDFALREIANSIHEQDDEQEKDKTQ